MLNMDLRDEGGATYQWMDTEPVWEFGEGGSFTSWAWTWVERPVVGQKKLMLSTEDLASMGSTDLPEVTVRNVGALDGSVVSLGFVAYDQAVPPEFGGVETAASPPLGGEYPKKVLFDFDRSVVAAGGSESVRLRLSAEAVSVVMQDGSRWLHPAHFSVRIGDGDGSTLTVELTGAPVQLPSYEWPPVSKG